MSFIPRADRANAFENFWAASELTDATQRSYASSLTEYVANSIDPGVEPLDPWSTNAAIRPLAAHPLDDLERAFRSRRSTREFGTTPLTTIQLERLAHSVAGGGQRTFASAGGIYAVQIIFALINVADDLHGKAVRVVSRDSVVGLAPICETPAWQEMAWKFGCLPELSHPGLVAVVCIDLEAMVAKYGERAGRFALIEAGHAAQNLTLRAAADELACYELGGYADNSLLPTLGIVRGGLRTASVLMIGTPLS
jgi:nitroreductase